MNKICLLVLIGLPGAGKTDFSEKLLNIIDSLNIVHICYDDFIKYNQSENINFKEKRKFLFDNIKQLVISIKSDNVTMPELLLKRSKIKYNLNEWLLIVDDNNYYRGMRHEFYKLCQEFKLSFGQVYVHATVDVALQRNSRRASSIPEQLIKKMDGLIEKPCENDRSWERNTLFINNSYKIEEIKKFIYKLFQQAEEKILLKTHSPITQSEIHEIDIVLRKKIGSIIGSLKSDAKDHVQTVATELNRKRKQILSETRNGVIRFSNINEYATLI